MTRFLLSIPLLFVLLWVVVIASWVTNLAMLTGCDFEPNYKCEVLHGAGLIPPVALVTAWFPSDEEKP